MSFWKNKNIVVTGGAGFIGSHLVDLLFKAGSHVVVVDDLSAEKRKIDHVPILTIDAGDPFAMSKVLVKNNIDVVFNLAAFVAGVLYNRKNHMEMFERNMRLQIVPAEASALAQVPHFLQVSSVCVYGEGYTHDAREKLGRDGEPGAANNGYAWAKRMGERALSWLDLNHAVIVRPSNMYGPYDDFGPRGHVIPALIKKCLNDDHELVLHGSGDEVREFLYADDAARGMMAAVEHGRHGELYNLGSTEHISMLNLAKLIRKHLGRTEKSIRVIGDDGGDRYRSSNLTKTTNQLGWKATTSLDDGLRSTIEWYRSTL